jgi:hypothetical protein
MKTTRFFQGLSLTSFGLAVYNTWNNIHIRRIKGELELERLKNLELQAKLDNLANKNLENLELIKESNKSLDENIQNIINSKDGSSGSKSLIDNNFIESIMNKHLLFFIYQVLFLYLYLYILLCLYF